MADEPPEAAPERTREDAMTDQASACAPARRTRRQLLAGGTTAVAAVLAAEALARPAPAYAGTDGDVVLGAPNSEQTPTIITNTNTDVTTGGVAALEVQASGNGSGLIAFADGGDGVQGEAGSGNGVSGSTSGNSNAGVFGENFGDGNGVYGHASNAAASGVYGQNDGTGLGVAGRAAGGVGTLGDSANGTGVWANSASATALKVTGRAEFSRSGVATVAGTSSAPANSVRVSLPITGKSMMTALLQKHVAGVYVVAAVPSVPGGHFTIYLNKAVRASVGPIAWMVTERP